MTNKKGFPTHMRNTISFLFLTAMILSSGYTNAYAEEIVTDEQAIVETTPIMEDCGIEDIVNIASDDVNHDDVYYEDDHYDHDCDEGLNSGEDDNSGKCGENATWSLDGNGVLRIVGTGLINGGNWGPPFNDGITERIKKVEIGEGITAISESNFQNCINIKSVSCPSSLNRIGTEAFKGCKNLETINLNANMTIGPGAFNGCEKLKEIEIPENVSLGSMAFANCKSLTHVTIGKGVLIPTEPETYIGTGICYGGNGTGPFYGCSKLLSAGPMGSGSDIEYSWSETIPAHAFAGSCIKTISFPNGLSQIGYSCFWNSKIEEIIIPDSVKIINTGAFCDCANLSHVVIPKVKLEGGNEFYGVNFNYITNSYYSYIFDNSLLLKSAGPIGSGCDIEYGWDTEIPDYAFCGAGLESVVFPATIKSLGAFSFAGCPFKSIDIPSHISKLGMYAFSGCKKLSSISLHEGLETIETSVFWISNPEKDTFSYILIPRSVSDMSFLVNFDNDVKLVCYADSYAYTSGKLMGYNVVDINDFSVEDPSANKTIYSFDANGGEGTPMNDLSIAYNAAKSLPKCTYYKNGYQFVSWNTNKDGTGTGYSDQEMIINSVDEERTITLYAQWGKILDGSKVTYNLNGGTNNPNNLSTVPQGVSFTLLDATRPGYSFGGWYSDAKCSKKKAVKSIVGAKGKDYTVYAKWTVNKYKVNYDGNGATSGKTSATTLTYDKSGKLAKCGFKKTGYSFKEWNTKPDGTGTSYPAGKSAVYNLSTTTAPATLYVIWKPIEYTVQFKAPDKNQTMAAITGAYAAALILPDSTFTKPGYTFDSWNTKSNGKGTKYTAGQEVVNLATKDKAKVTLYPIWKYEVAFDSNGGTGEMSNQVLYFNVSEKLKDNKFERTGYTFNGWKATIDGKSKSFKNKASVKNLVSKQGECVTLMAQWTPITYTVSFDANTGNAKEDKAFAKKNKPINVKYDENVSFPKCTAQKDGYVFLGWNFTGSENQDIIPAETIHNNLAEGPQCVDYKGVWKKEADYVPVSAITFSSDRITMRVNDTKTLELGQDWFIAPENATDKTVTWTSSDTSIAAVDNGVVKAVAPGKVTITAKTSSVVMIGPVPSIPSDSIEIEIMDIECAMFPMEYLNIINGEGGHSGRKCIDIAGRDENKDDFIAPFSGKIIRFVEDGNGVVIQSNEPVLFADGTVDYVTLWLAHDDDISDLSVGMEFKQGDVIYQEGKTGKASCNHVHMASARGQFSGLLDLGDRGWTLQNEYSAYNIFWIDDNTKIVSTGGYTWNKK